MTSKPIYIRKFCFWAPGVETAEDLDLFAQGGKDISCVSAVPALPFVSMLLRRRMSDVTKMAVYTNHFVSEGLPPAKITFVSEFGEVRLQLKISDHLIETDTVSPAAFSLSVFNVPVSCSTIVEKNMEGYSAGYAGKKSFEYGLLDCVNALRLGECENRIFLFSDELVPDVYAPVVDKYPNVPCALAMYLTTVKSDGCVELDMSDLPDTTFAAEQAAFFAKRLVKEMRPCP